MATANRATGSGTINFGLVAIPFKIYTAASSESVAFHLLHAKCGNRIKQQTRCPVCAEDIDREKTIRGYEYAKNQYVQMPEDDLASLAGAASQAIEILEFVPLAKVDPVYFEKSYHIGPDKGGDKAYALLTSAMREAGTVAVGKFVLRGKENIVLLRPTLTGSLMMHTMYFVDEVRNFSVAPIGVSKTELELAGRLIAELSTKDFQPEKYQDEYRDRVLDVIQKKIDGKEITISAPLPKSAQVIDLMSALKASIGKKGAVSVLAGEKAKAKKAVSK